MDDLQTCICVHTYVWLEINLVVSHIPLGMPETALRKQVRKVQEKTRTFSCIRSLDAMSEP